MLSKLKAKNKYFISFCFSTLLLLTIYPFLINKYPASVDYINHLASFYIQANIDNDHWLSENYFVKWDIKPYNLIEFLGGVLARYFQISVSGRIVLILGIIFICTGGLLIRKFINGRIDLWTCSIFLLIYNHVLFFGFVNYYVSSGLALVAIGLWIRLRNINYIANILLFTSVSTILFFCHLYALGIYAFFVVSYEIGLIIYSNNKLFSFSTTKTFSQFLLPIILFLIYWNALPNKGVVEFYTYGNVASKIVALFSPLAYDFSQNELSIIASILISILVLRFIYPGGISIYNNMKIPLLFILIITIAMPSSLSGVWGTDFRYPFVFLFLFVISLRFDENNQNTLYFRRACISIIIIATCYKIYYISENWKKINQQYLEFENALQYVGKGSKVLTIQQDTEILTGNNPRLYDHMPALLIIERSAFWPLLFTMGNSIYPTTKTEQIDTATGPNLTLADLVNKKYKNGYFFAINCKVYWEKWEQDFDYLVSIRFNDLKTISLKNLKLKFRGSFFDIYQIIH